jgi:hypothetical protein
MDLPDASAAVSATPALQPAPGLGQPLAELLARRRTWLPWSFVVLSTPCIGVLIWVSILGSRGCGIPPISLGRSSDLSVALSANTPCAILVKPPSAPIDAISIDAPPQHGTLTSRGRTGVVYRPHPGFKGSDAFAFSLHRRSDATPQSFPIHVRMVVN